MSTEINSAFRVFWKSREWNVRKSTHDSDQEIPLSLRRRYFRRKKTRLSRYSKYSEDHEKPQSCDQMITFPCSICKHEIDLRETFLHKKQHMALATLEFQWMGEKKPALPVITIQRQFIITKLLSSSLFTEKILESINYAFELLWQKQIPAYYKMIENVHRSSIYSQTISHVLIKGVAICEDGNSAWKADMNDKFTVVDNFGKKPDVCFFGLFDGHHGASAANLTSVELPVLFLHQLSRFDPSYHMTSEEQNVIKSFLTVFREEYIAKEELFSSIKKRRKTGKCEYENIHKAFAKAFWRMDRLLRLGRNEVSRVRWSGCSAVTCILEGNIKTPYTKKNWRMSNDDGLPKNSPSQVMPQTISGVLHVANTGNVQAVLCRNGKGFCITKEHTTRNITERRRLLKNGAIISSNEPYGLLEGQIKTTRGLGFHGNLKLKKSIIPAPQTISVPIDDLCQFLILATNGLWEVLDTKEVTALAMTMFQVYKDTYYSITQNQSLPSKEPFLINELSNTKSESNIRILFQYKSESTECVPTINTKENLFDSKYSNPKNAQTFPSEMTNHHLYSEKERNGPTSVDVSKNSSEKESCIKNFYEGAAKYISHELVSAALVAGSRDNITVMVILLKGSEYQFLT
ncbi:protein phosphatase 2C-like domain-containing protein 1 [Vulpes vulpes]|uniref:Protein phosphatase 2C-like domain-containing protein 1 n=1 Tax=Vulpes vulpes TaxID=9627 RepID=A0A3Q7SYQ6_VULVU